ncbi:hypothetical protein PAMP_013476 [Pampus punctatissimus]
MARRAGATRGSRGSSASNRGGAAGGAAGEGGGGEKCEAGLAERLPGDTTRGGGTGGIAEEQSGSLGRAVLGAGCVSAASGAAAGGGLGGVLLQHGADPNIRNTDGKSALDLAEPSAKAVLTD